MTRPSVDIGAGLAPARPPVAIPAGQRIHVVGVAGAGASAAALLAQAAGAVVDGCDPGGPSPYTAALVAAGIPIAWQHDASHVEGQPRPDRLAVTKALTAIDPDHPELAAARNIGIPVEPWHQVMSDASVGRRLLAVAGTHGKSTTSGWLVHVLHEAGRDPSAFVGALLPGDLVGGVPATARIGRGPEFVVEADEYAGNFDPYLPSIVVVGNVEWDHPDVFADLATTLDALEQWLRAAASADTAATLVINVGDPGAAALRGRLTDWPGRLVEFEVVEADGLGSASGGDHTDTGHSRSAVLQARILASGPMGTAIELDSGSLDSPLRIDLPSAGRHNVANAAAAAAAALAVGVSPHDLARGLASFPGVGRRLERLGEAGGVVVYDDYGHHPTAIRETLLAVRQREPGRRIWAVYEPLTYHRTAAMLDEFAHALAAADGVAIAQIWPGRDPDTSLTSAPALASAVLAHRPGIVVGAPGTVEETAAWMVSRVLPGDAVLVMGGGRSYLIGRMVLEELSQ